MATCMTVAPVSALATHLDRTSAGPSRLACTADAADKASFRAVSAESIARSTAIEQDWHTFAAPKPRSQLQACPPFDFPPRPRTTLVSYLEAHASSFLSGSPSTASSFASEYDEYDDDRLGVPLASLLETSARWSPEVETALEARRSAASPALSASSYASEVPTPDEADRICCARCVARFAKCCEGRRGGGEVLEVVAEDATRVEEGDEGERSTHPLTWHAASEAEWDFDRLFARRRRWSDGKRVRHSHAPHTANEATIDERGGRTEQHHPLGKRRSRSRSRSRLCEEVLPSPPATAAGAIASAHETLRATAMSRLASIVKHLGGEAKATLG